VRQHKEMEMDDLQNIRVVANIFLEGTLLGHYELYIGIYETISYLQAVCGTSDRRSGSILLRTMCVGHICS
jgi:hypothetical protein